MKQIRRNVFETNSSSTHSVSIAEYNLEPSRLDIVEYDENQNVIAGILGGTYWGWLHIDILWVDEKFRRKKIGSQLLIAAENEAKKRGCHSVHVDTMSWQAPEFYKKHGYELISELDNIPNGYKKFHFVKRLDV
mgnify:CR=1 FL=1